MSGELVSKEVLLDLIRTFTISKHAHSQIKKRSKMLNRYDIQEALLNNVLAYGNTDGSINVAIDKFNYFVFGKKHGHGNMITYKETSGNGIDIFQKWKMAKDGFARKLHNGK